MVDSFFAFLPQRLSHLVPKAFRYALIGALCALLDLSLFTAATGLTSLNPVKINLVTYAIGTLVSYHVNANYNFNKHDKTKLRLLFFCVAAVFGMAISGFIVSCSDYFHMNAVVMKVISIGFVFLFQFNFNNFITFR